MHPGQEFLFVKGFDNVVVGSGLETANDVVFAPF